MLFFLSIQIRTYGSRRRRRTWPNNAATNIARTACASETHRCATVTVAKHWTPCSDRCASKTFRWTSRSLSAPITVWPTRRRDAVHRSRHFVCCCGWHRRWRWRRRRLSRSSWRGDAKACGVDGDEDEDEDGADDDDDDGEIGDAKTKNCDFRKKKKKNINLLLLLL